MKSGGKTMRSTPVAKTQAIDWDDWTREHFDIQELELVEQQQIEELVEALVNYCRQLEKQVVSLRCQVNRLTAVDKPKPFPELHSDLYQSFYQYAAYPKFKRILKHLE